MGKINFNQMTEEQFHQYINSIVTEQLEAFKKNLLLEMPYPRNVYKEKVDALLPQLLTNWCLVRYRTITNTKPYKKHWQGKTYGFMTSIARYCLKGNDSIAARKKVFDEVIYENDFLIEQFLRLTVCAKFSEEQIDTNSEAFKTTVLDCIKAIPSIVDTILNRDENKMREYTLNI